MPRYIDELVTRQVRRSQLARLKSAEHAACPGLVVAISRGMGTGARVIAAKVAAELEWSLWDKELIDAIAQDADVSRKVVEAFDEHTVSEIELIARSALGDQEMGDFLYARHLARTIGAIAKHGHAIILGRGARFILPDALSIRIDAPFELRVRNMMNFENLTHDQAVAKLKQSDRDRESFLISIFGKQRVHSAHYELSLWMEKFSTDDAAEILKAAITTRCRTMAESAG